MTRAELADEIARAAVRFAEHRSLASDLVRAWRGRAMAYENQWWEAVAYARGFLAARQQAPR